MARSGNKKRKNRSLNKLQEMGFMACGAGVVMLLFPAFAGKSHVLAGLASLGNRLGWWVLAIGIALLVLHQLVKKTPSQSAAALDSVSGTDRAQERRPKPQRASTARTEPHWTESPNTAAAPGAHAAPSPAQAPARPTPTTWGADVFAAIEWRRFEAVCETLFAQSGFETQSQSHGTDGGVDIWLRSRNAEGPVAVVQCKHWQGKPVGVKEMREFFGVMASHQLKRGTYATTSSYTPDAQQFAKANGINALDGAGLLKLIAARTPEQQQALLQVAFEGDYGRPTCASCGTKMVERTPSKGAPAFGVAVVTHAASRGCRWWRGFKKLRSDFNSRHGRRISDDFIDVNRYPPFIAYADYGRPLAS